MLEWDIEKTEGPIAAAAIHNGHKIDKDIEPLIELSEPERLREEDPYTGLWTGAGNSKIILQTSRFQVDVNRPPEKSIYLSPEDSWGLKVWRTPPGEAILARLYEDYNKFYASVKELFDPLIKAHGKIFVFDIHTYNHRRAGADMPPDDPEKNPEVNIGTANISRGKWAPLIERFMKDIALFDYAGRHLDVRENVKFKGGYFSKWLNMTYGDNACCLAIEFKKFFMDEWTGKPDMKQVELIKEALHSTVPGIKEELRKAGADF
jgi:N-formylglutamate amidohydrolase